VRAQALRHSLDLCIRVWSYVAGELSLQDAAKGVDMGSERSEKEGLSVRHYQQGGKVLHLDRIHQFCLVFDVYPGKLRRRKLALQLVEQSPVVAAGATPLRAQARDQQIRGRRG
jgi:hypothetical protein